jgi:acyl-CoA thioester hydrolase
MKAEGRTQKAEGGKMKASGGPLKDGFGKLDMRLADTRVLIYRFTVPEDAIDQNGHMNKEMYIRWMQDVAVVHSDMTGGTAAMRAAGGTWIVRTHQVVYVNPAFAGERVDVTTWVVNMRRARSLRRYKFVRVLGGKLLARGETDWVFVGVDDGRPQTIPESVRACFPLSRDGK